MANCWFAESASFWFSTGAWGVEIPDTAGAWEAGAEGLTALEEGFPLGDGAGCVFETDTEGVVADNVLIVGGVLAGGTPAGGVLASVVLSGGTPGNVFCGSVLVDSAFVSAPLSAAPDAVVCAELAVVTGPGLAASEVGVPVPGVGCIVIKTVEIEIESITVGMSSMGTRVMVRSPP